MTRFFSPASPQSPCSLFPVVMGTATVPTSMLRSKTLHAGHWCWPSHWRLYPHKTLSPPRAHRRSLPESICAYPACLVGDVGSNQSLGDVTVFPIAAYRWCQVLEIAS